MTQRHAKTLAVLDSLRRERYKVYISHKRPVGPPDEEGLPTLIATRYDLNKLKLGPSVWWPTGGCTIVTICDQKGTPLAIGEADCSVKDSFNKKVGLAIALGRAMKAGADKIATEPAEAQ